MIRRKNCQSIGYTAVSLVRHLRARALRGCLPVALRNHASAALNAREIKRTDTFLLMLYRLQYMVPNDA